MSKYITSCFRFMAFYLSFAALGIYLMNTYHSESYLYMMGFLGGIIVMLLGGIWIEN